VNPYLVGAVAAIAAGGSYAISLIRRPWHDCRTCNGGGRDRGVIFKHSYRECDSCGGNGKMPRAGVRVFQSARSHVLKWGKPRRGQQL